ncbi:MAG TPA: hypothetical protein VEW05_31605 [Candidatus Polarisedimenticolia bacterium]|nr:hypothetical protein [Candidatus Polarisedimenticolia bacterium]
MRHLVRLFTCLLTVFCVSLPASSFDTPLSDEAVREAYFLGQRHDEKLSFFFETYRRYVPAPKSGPHVFMAELLTPFAQMVGASLKHSTGYSAQQAQLDYRNHGDYVHVGIHVAYTSTYGPGFPYSPNKVPGPTGTWKDFQVRLSQQKNTIEPRSVSYEGTRIGTGGKGGGSRPTGFIIWLVYDVCQFTADDASVEVDTPDGQHVTATFDLTRLR